MRNTFLQISWDISIWLNSREQPSVIIAFTFDKMKDRNNVDITIEDVHENAQALSLGRKTLNIIKIFP